MPCVGKTFFCPRVVTNCLSVSICSSLSSRSRVCQVVTGDRIQQPTVRPSLQTYQSATLACCVAQWFVWLNGLVVSALVMRTRGPWFESRVAPLFHWAAPWASCLHTLPPQFLSSKKLEYKREFSAPKWLW